MAKDGLTAPTAEIGYQQAVNYNWWQFIDEPTPELQWPQSVSVYDQMRRQDAQIVSVLRAMTLPLRRTPWRVDPAGARAKVTQFVADDLGLPIVGKPARKPTARTKDKFSWPEHLRLALLMLPFGFSYFEQVYRITPDGKEAHLRKLAYRPPQTIQYVNVAQDGGLESIQQYWVRTEERPKPIPVTQLVAYVHEREGGNWLGLSILRAAYKNWLLKDRLLRVQAQTIERNGMGVPLYIAAEIETDLAAGTAMAQAWRSGEAAGAAIPFGANMMLRGVEGDLPDADVPIRYHDEQIARAVLAHFLNLGTQTGSWALGSTFADFFVASLQALAEQIADTVTQHVIEDLVDLNFGPDEPAPRLCFDMIGSQQAPTAEALKLLFDAGAIRRDEPLETFMRQQYGLPPADPATADPVPAPDGMPAVPAATGPSPVEPDYGAESVAAAQAVAAGRHSFDPLEHRDHDGQWTSGPAGDAKKFADKLGLKGKVQLGDGESFVGSDVFESYEDNVDLAFIDRAGQQVTRLSLSPRHHEGNWDGSVDGNTAVLDGHQKAALADGLQDALKQLKVKQREYKKMFKRGDVLAEANKEDTPEGRDLFAKIDALEHDAGVSGVITGLDGTQVRWHSELSNEDGAPYLNVQAGPEGDDENRTYESTFLPDARWINKFIAKLRAEAPAASAADEDTDHLLAALGHDTTPGHDELHHYWVAGPGLAKWAGSPEPWTTLVALLTPHVGPAKAKVYASRWFIEHFGYAAGSDKNRVAHGHPPRGHLVGPG